MEHRASKDLITISLRPSLRSLSRFFFISHVRLYHLCTSVRTGYGLVSRCTPGEWRVDFQAPHATDRLRGALFSSPLLITCLALLVSLSIFFSLHFISLYSSLFSMRMCEATRARIHNRPARARAHSIILSFDFSCATKLDGTKPPSPSRVAGETISVRVTRSAVTHPHWIDERIVCRREVKNYNFINDARHNSHFIKRYISNGYQRACCFN